MVPRSDKDIILALGGPATVAAALELTEHAVKKWMQGDRGIPWKARHRVKALASKRRSKLPPDFLHERRVG